MADHHVGICEGVFMLCLTVDLVPTLCRVAIFLHFTDLETETPRLKPHSSLTREPWVESMSVTHYTLGCLWGTATLFCGIE